MKYRAFTNKQIKILELVMALPLVIVRSDRVGGFVLINLKFNSHEVNGTILSSTVFFTSSLKKSFFLSKLDFNFFWL